MNKKIIQSFLFRDQKDDIRLDYFVAEKLEITRSNSQRMVRGDEIEVNGETQRAKYVLKSGDIVNVLARNDLMKVKKVPIIFEDEYVLVIDKPSGISAHPAPGERDITVVEAFKDKLNSQAVSYRPGIVHRLDKGTSGVMVLAKTDAALEYLKNEFKKRNVKKIYNALVHGQIKPETGVINMPLEREVRDRKRIGISSNGREAVTEYKTLRTFPGYSLLEVTPKTGRTHQIRVHLSALGYPIGGDRKYGGNLDEFQRIFLHASSLSFRHPSTKKMVTFESELPKELKDILGSLD